MLILNNLPRTNAGRCLLIKSSFLCLFALFLIASSGTRADARESWDLVESGNFLVYYHGNVKSAQKIVDIAEDFYPKMRRLMGDVRLGKIEIWVCEAQSEFQAAVHAPIQDWAIGCAFPLSRRIIIQNPRVIIQRDFQLSQVIRHEIVHIIFGQRTQKAIGKIPRWFVEGIAIYFSGRVGASAQRCADETYLLKVGDSACRAHARIPEIWKPRATGVRGKPKRRCVAGGNRGC